MMKLYKKAAAAAVLFCAAALFTVTAAAVQLTGPPVAAPADEKRLKTDVTLDGISLSDRPYPLLYREFNLRTQQFLQNFELKVTLNNKEYYLYAGDIGFDIDTLGLLDRLMFNSGANTQGNTFFTNYSYDEDKVKAFADDIVNELNATVPPVRSYAPTFNLKTRTFSSVPAPSQMIGYDLNPGSFLSQINEKIDEAINNTEHNASLDIKTNPVYSKADPNPAAGFGLLGTYTTHTTNVPNRNTNIRLASEALSGFKLRPGSTFSFNNALGYTSADKGYKEAGILINGEPDTGLGGGICQVSSTLYNAVLAAGMRVVERHAHSAPVGYVPPDRDATVSYGGPDFRFRNNTPNDCYLVFGYDNRSLTVSVFRKN